MGSCSQRRRQVGAVAAFVAALSPHLGVGPAKAAQNARPALVFSIDQGLPSGITENDDLASLERMFATISKFRSRFDVYAIFSPLTRKTGNLRDVLRSAARHHIPFLLDVYSSDAMALGNVDIAVNASADPPHGLAASIKYLRQLKADPDIGPSFVGIRIFEVLASDFAVGVCRERAAGPRRVNWCDHFSKNVPADNVLQRATATALLEFARAHGQWVLWSDWKWDSQTREQQTILKRLLATGRYRNVVVLAYANNLPEEAARGDEANWEQWRAEYQPLVGDEIKGLGLSDQSWTCAYHLGCPVDVLARWAQRARAAGAEVIELESASYFFTLPNGAKAAGYPDSTRWRQVGGRPSDQLVLLARSLGVDIAGAEPRPASALGPNHAACLSLEAAKTALAPGEIFTASAIMQNTGGNVWETPDDVLSSVGSERWGMPDLKLPKSLVRGGEQVSFTLSLRAPFEPGGKRLDLQMKQTSGAAFGQPCSQLLNVIKSESSRQPQ